MMHTVNSRLFHYKRQASFEITKTYIHTTHACYKTFLLFATWTLPLAWLCGWAGASFYTYCNLADPSLLINLIMAGVPSLLINPSME
jgi:hypothetical protein